MHDFARLHQQVSEDDGTPLKAVLCAGKRAFDDVGHFGKSIHPFPGFEHTAFTACIGPCKPAHCRRDNNVSRIEKVVGTSAVLAHELVGVVEAQDQLAPAGAGERQEPAQFGRGQAQGRRFFRHFQGSKVRIR